MNEEEILPLHKSDSTYTIRAPPPVGSVESMRKRRVATDTEGGGQLPGGGKRPPAQDREKDVAVFLIRCIIACIPKRWNPKNPEIGLTKWEHRLRVRWLDSGLYKRKIMWAIVVFAVVLGAFLVSTMVPWRLLLRTDVTQVYTDHRGREIHNILVPRLIDPKTDASDAQVADRILRGGGFEALTQPTVKQGYAVVRGSNVSLDMLRSKLTDAAFGKYRCLCAAHMGVPLNAIVLSPPPDKIRLWRQDPKAHPFAKSDRVFMLEPSPTGATGSAVQSGKMQSNLDPGVPFRVKQPTRMSVKFFTMNGLVDRMELRGDDAACAVRCIELAWKEALVDEDGERILAERPRSTSDQHGRSIMHRQYVQFG